MVWRTSPCTPRLFTKSRFAELDSCRRETPPLVCQISRLQPCLALCIILLDPYARKLSLDPFSSLAPSPRLIALLAKRARLANPTMALVEITQGLPPLEEKKPFVEPPPVIAPPCDPWPAPYYLESGLRRVAPYHYTYNTYCKQRWRGRELLDIFSSEFRDRPLGYYVCLPS